MFYINFKIVKTIFDDLIREDGFYQISCNGYLYGDMYSDELQEVMDKVSIYNWMERFLILAYRLQFENYLLLSDTDSFNTWIEFCREEDKLFVSIVIGEKPDGSGDIENRPLIVEQDDWFNQKILFEQFKNEVIDKSKQYIGIIKEMNGADCKLIKDFESKILLLEQT